MKLLTKDNEIVEGTEITDAAAKFVEDITEGVEGVSMYSHQKKAMIKYVLGTFDLSLKPQPEPTPEVVATPSEDAETEVVDGTL